MAETLYLENANVFLARTDPNAPLEVVNRDQHNIGRCFMTRLPNKARPFQMEGRSEITRAVRYYTDAAVRTMKLGTGSTSAGNAPAKTGTGAALTGYLTGSNKAFDATFPSSALNGSSRRIQYKRTYAAGEATSASPITEAVIVNETISNDDTSTSGETLARVALSGISAKGASDSLVVTWNHDLLGA